MRDSCWVPSQTVIGLSALSKDLNYWRQEVQMLNFLNEKSVRLNLLGNGASCLSRSLTKIFRSICSASSWAGSWSGFTGWLQDFGMPFDRIDPKTYYTFSRLWIMIKPIVSCGRSPKPPDRKLLLGLKLRVPSWVNRTEPGKYLFFLDLSW